VNFIHAVPFVTRQKVTSAPDTLESKIGATRAFFNRRRRQRGDLSPIQQHTYEETIRHIPSGTTPSTAVDLGCHWGRYTSVMAQTYGKVIGIDFADEALASAETAGNIHYVQLDLNVQPGELIRFAPVDLFLAVALLEMVVDPMALCQSMASATKPGGKVLAFIPNRLSLNYLSLRGGLWLARVLFGHRNRYIHNNGITVRQLNRHLQSAGFEIEQQGAMSGIPVFLADRLPHSWQRALLKIEPAVKRLLGGSYHWVLGRKP
jgi:2-polyprenyl-3-methyl-5-hydroxy-6-metoxy-1,4-benzoquinol methylase